MIDNKGVTKKKKTILHICAAVVAAFITVKTAHAAAPLSSIDDVRVGPLLTTSWAQGSLDSAGTIHCYNYYTPLNRVCGCTATAIGQIMYYHRYPTTRILPGETLYDTIDGYGRYEVGTDGNGGMTNTTTGTYTEFDPPYGGPYNWNLMVPSPTSSTSEDSRKDWPAHPRRGFCGVFALLHGRDERLHGRCRLQHHSEPPLRGCREDRVQREQAHREP